MRPLFITGWYCYLVFHSDQVYKFTKRELDRYKQPWSLCQSITHIESCMYSRASGMTSRVPTNNHLTISHFPWTQRLIHKAIYSTQKVMLNVCFILEVSALRGVLNCACNNIWCELGSVFSGKTFKELGNIAQRGSLHSQTTCDSNITTSEI